jgi:hypothetical protein
MIVAGMIVFAAFSVALLLALCASGTIPRNRAVGIPSSELIRSEAAWTVGHSAAVGPAAGGAAFGALIWVMADLAAADSPIVPIAVMATVVAGLGWARAWAIAEARMAPDPSADDGEAERPLASAKITHSGGLILAAAMSWLPAAALAVYRLAIPEIPAWIASHWDLAGRPDGYVAEGPAFWVCLGAGVLSSLVVTAFVIFVGDDLGRFTGSAGLGVLVALSGMFTLTWITSVRANSDPSTPIFMLWPPALLVGMLVFALASVRRPPDAPAHSSGARPS